MHTRAYVCVCVSVSIYVYVMTCMYKSGENLWDLTLFLYCVSHRDPLRLWVTGIHSGCSLAGKCLYPLTLVLPIKDFCVCLCSHKCVYACVGAMVGGRGQPLVAFLRHCPPLVWDNVSLAWDLSIWTWPDWHFCLHVTEIASTSRLAWCFCVSFEDCMLELLTRQALYWLIRLSNLLKYLYLGVSEALFHANMCPREEEIPSFSGDLGLHCDISFFPSPSPVFSLHSGLW